MKLPCWIKHCWHSLGKRKETGTEYHPSYILLVECCKCKKTTWVKGGYLI